MIRSQRQQPKPTYNNQPLQQRTLSRRNAAPLLKIVRGQQHAKDNDHDEVPLPKSKATSIEEDIDREPESSSDECATKSPRPSQEKRPSDSQSGGSAKKRRRKADYERTEKPDIDQELTVKQPVIRRALKKNSYRNRGAVAPQDTSNKSKDKDTTFINIHTKGQISKDDLSEAKSKSLSHAEWYNTNQYVQQRRNRGSNYRQRLPR
jgi:hypothetical protein